MNVGRDLYRVCELLCRLYMTTSNGNEFGRILKLELYVRVGGDRNWDCVRVYRFLCVFFPIMLDGLV